MEHLTDVPHRIRIETSQTGRAVIKGEEVYTRNDRFQLLLGHWIKSPTSPAQERQGAEKLDASFSDCRKLGEALIGNEAVWIYTAKTRNASIIPFEGALKVWISKPRGVPLRTEADVQIPLLGPSHTTKIYDYENVRPPL